MKDSRCILGDGLTRLDLLLARETGLSRGKVQDLVKKGACRIDGVTELKTGTKAPEGAQIILVLPEKTPGEEPLVPQALPLDILYEDDWVLALNKPSGMVVHPGAGNNKNTLANALLYHVSNLSQIGGQQRPGIVHRLDKDTSGLILVAKDDETHLALSRQLKARQVEKHYLALVWGNIKEEGEINRPIARSKKDRKKMALDPLGKKALTKWQRLNQKGQYSLLDVQIITGRTHQIRVHMASLGHPVVGDVIYGKKEKKKTARLMLHAHSLTFFHPHLKKRMTLTAPVPAVFEQWFSPLI